MDQTAIPVSLYAGGQLVYGLIGKALHSLVQLGRIS